MDKLTKTPRTNSEWIEQLSDPVDKQALFDLHNLLQHGLRPALKDMITKDLDLRIEEFTQLGLIKIQEEIPTFNGKGNFTTWALKVAIHIAFTALRYERLLDNFLDKIFIPAKRRFSIPRIQNNLENDLVVEQIQSNILAVLGSLIEKDITESQRAALIAVYQQGLSERDSARQLGISPDELDKQLTGVRTQIRRLIREKLDLSAWDVITLFKRPYQNPEGVNNQHLENKMKIDQQIQTDR